MLRFPWPIGVLVLGLAGALVGVVPDGVSAVTGRARCRPTAFVTNAEDDTVSTIDVQTRTKDPVDIPVGPEPFGVTVTPDSKTLLVTHANALAVPVVPGSVSTIDVKTRTKDPTDIAVGLSPFGVAVTPCRR